MTRNQLNRSLLRIVLMLMSIIIVILLFISQPIFPIASGHQYPPALANKDKLNNHVISLSYFSELKVAGTESYFQNLV